MSGRTKLAAPSFEPEAPQPALELAPVELSLAVPVSPWAAPEPSLAVRELLGFDPRLLTEPPLLSTTLVCRPANGDGQLVVTTSRTAYEAARTRKVPVFAGGELWLLTLAAEHDRASSAAVRAWCAQKAEDPTWRLTLEVAIGGAFGDWEPRGWRLGQVLRAFGLTLVDVAVGETLPDLLEQTGGVS